MAQGAVRNIGAWFREEFASERLLPGLIAGLLLGITEVFLSLSLGSLIFSGDLASYLPYGVGIALVTATSMLVTVALTSRVPGAMGSTQDSTSVVLGVIAGGLAGTLAQARPEVKLATILAAIALTTLLTGAFYLVLGLLKLGRLVRFVPYPVIGGFLAGTGWMLVQGSVGVMTGRVIFFTMTALPDSEAATSRVLMPAASNTRLMASATTPASMIAPSTIASRGSGSLAKAATRYALPDGFSSMALTALDPMSRPTTAFVLRNIWSVGP